MKVGGGRIRRARDGRRRAGSTAPTSSSRPMAAPTRSTARAGGRTCSSATSTRSIPALVGAPGGRRRAGSSGIRPTRRRPTPSWRSRPPWRPARPRSSLLGAIGGERLDHELANLLLLADPALAGPRRAARPRPHDGRASCAAASGWSSRRRRRPRHAAADRRRRRRRDDRRACAGRSTARRSRWGGRAASSNEVVGARRHRSRLERGALLVVETATERSTAMTSTIRPATRLAHRRHRRRAPSWPSPSASSSSPGTRWPRPPCRSSRSCRRRRRCSTASGCCPASWSASSCVARAPRSSAGSCLPRCPVVLGSPYGADALVSGAIQGGGAELGFAIGLYRRWTLPFAMLCRRARRAGGGDPRRPRLLPRCRCGRSGSSTRSRSVASGAVVAGIGAWLLLRALVADRRAGRRSRRGASSARSDRTPTMPP